MIVVTRTTREIGEYINRLSVQETNRTMIKMKKTVHNPAGEIPKITYSEFLKELKTVCVAIGLNPAFFATHS
jgi:transcription antitermination factor NusA-like protein